MKLETVLATALLGQLAATSSGCVTTALYDRLAKPQTEAITVPGSSAAVTRITGASVAMVESRLTLYVAVARKDGLPQIYAASLQGHDVEGEGLADQLAPVSSPFELPVSACPVLFAAETDGGFVNRDASFWANLRVSDDPSSVSSATARPLGREDMEHAALISIHRGEGLFHVSASVPDRPGRALEETPGGVRPVIDAEHESSSFVLEGPPATVEHTETKRPVAGTVAFLGFLPASVAIDVALVGAGVALVVPLLPFALLTGGRGFVGG